MKKTTEEKIKDGIIIKLRRRSDVLEKDIPFFSIGDMAKTYAVLMEEMGISVSVSYKMLGKWGMTLEELDEIAQEYAPANREYEIVNMLNMIMEMKDELIMSGLITPEEAEDMTGPEMYVLRYKENNPGGAAAICYPGVLDEIGNVNEDVWLIPSSIHEWLIIKDNKENFADIEKMIGEVNRGIVREEEQLSDLAYHYHRGDKQIETASRWTGRSAFL